MSRLLNKIPGTFDKNYNDHQISQLLKGEEVAIQRLENIQYRGGELAEEGNIMKLVRARQAAPRNPQFTFRSVKNVDQRANKMYAVVWVCFLLSTILSIVLFVCYKKQVIINIRDFAIAVLALNTLLFAVSIVCMCCYRGLGNVLKSRAFIILVLLVLEIGDIALSVYTYLKI